MQPKDINMTLDAVMLAEAKALRIHDSQAAEAGVSKSVASEELWLAANREVLESSNAYVEQNGLPLAHHRHF